MLDSKELDNSLIEADQPSSPGEAMVDGELYDLWQPEATDNTLHPSGGSSVYQDGKSTPAAG